MSDSNDILEGYLKSGTLTDMFGDLEGAEPTGKDVSNLLTYPIDPRKPDDIIENPFIDLVSHYLEKPEYTFDYTGLTVNDIPDLFDAFSRLYLFQMLPKSYLEQAVAPKIPMDNTIYYMMQTHLLQTLEKPDALWAYTEENPAFLSNLLVAMFFNPNVDVSTFYPVLQKLAEDLSKIQTLNQPEDQPEDQPEEPPKNPTVKQMFTNFFPKFENIYNFVDLDPDFYRRYATLSSKKEEIPQTDLVKFEVKPTKYFRTLLPAPPYQRWGSYLGEPYKPSSQFVQDESTTTISPREAIIFGIDPFIPQDVVRFAPVNYTELVLASVYNISKRSWEFIKKHVPNQQRFLVSFDGDRIETKTFKAIPTNYPVALSRPDNESKVTVIVDPFKPIITIPTTFNPLMIAVRENNLVAVKSILEVAPQSADVADSNGVTALNVAARAPHNKKIIQLLLPGSNIAYGDQNGVSPLIATVVKSPHFRYPGELDAILDRLTPAEINWYQPNGRTSQTALVMAARLNREEDVEKLIAAGANTNLRVPLIAAIEQKNETNFMKILLTVNDAASQGVDPQYGGLTQIDVTLDEPLNTAITYNMPLAVKVLISAGAEVNAAVLGEAITRGKIEVLAIIMAQFKPQERKAIFAEKKYQYYHDRIDDVKQYLKDHPEIKKIKRVKDPYQLVAEYAGGRTFKESDIESEDIVMDEPTEEVVMEEPIDFEKLKISYGHNGYTQKQLREIAAEVGVRTTKSMSKSQLTPLLLNYFT